MSVVIPTYNRAALLQKTLASVARQTLPHDTIEVVVVDDGSSDHSKSVVTSFESRLTLKYVYQPDRGFRVARARNLGIKLAEGELCVFVDSGVVLAPDCLAAYVAAERAARAPLAQIGYMLGFSQDDSNAQLLSQLLQQHGEAAALEQLAGSDDDLREVVYAECGDDLARLPAPWVLFWTCNVAVTRTALVALGGFDEAYESWGCEDVDLGLALHRAGVRFALCRTARALHYPHPKSRADNARSSAANRRYLHGKYGLRATELLLTKRCVELNEILATESGRVRV